jgi:colicin import membrane protein
MAERASDRWVSIVLSVLLHGALVAALAWGWWTFRQQPHPPTPTLAIEATVVDARAISGAARQPPPQPPPPAPPAPEPQTQPQVEPEGPPTPTPEELAKREQAQKDQAEKAAADRAAAEQRKADEQKRQEQEQRQTEEKRQADEQRQAQERAEAERKAHEEADAKKRAEERRAAEQKRLDDQKRQADEKRKADEARQRAEREAELRRSLDAEEHVMTARSSGALASWQAQITARIQRAWLRPPSARAGIECVLYVTQVPGGEIVNVRLGSCNGDQAVRESIEAAAYRASPLPPPPDPALFERNLEITFKPD